MKKFISILMCLAMCLAFVGCTKKTEKVSAKATKTVVDIYGRKVEVPKKVKNIVTLGAGGLRLSCYAGAQDMVVGVEESEHKKTLAKAYNYVNYDKIKDLPIVGKGGSGGYTPYVEEIIKLNPDVIIAAYTKDAAADLQEKTGVPVVAIDYECSFDEPFYKCMEILGQTLNKEDRCKEVVDYIKKSKEDLNKRTKDVPESKKSSVYFGACSFCGGHGIEGTFTNCPALKSINIKSVSDDLAKGTSGVTIDYEKILDWNPDIIFLDPNNMSYVNKHYKTNKNFYNSLKAVKNKKVYTQVAYVWYSANIETAIINSYYAGKVIYPDKFKDVDIEKKANEVYTKMLGKDASNLYNDMVKGGLSWGEITIGE